MRHSFAAYHLIEHQNAALTAFLLGHPNPNLLYSTYKELANRQEAKAFWEILPKEIELEKALAKQRKGDEERDTTQKILEQLRESNI